MPQCALLKRGEAMGPPIRLSLKQGPNLITLCSPRPLRHEVSDLKRKKKVSPAPILPSSSKGKARRTLMSFL